MACLTAAQRTNLEARKTILETQLAAANTAYTESIAASSVKSYRFDPGDATQQATRRDQKELLDTIDSLQARLDAINNRLKGTGLVTMRLRR